MNKAAEGFTYTQDFLSRGEQDALLDELRALTYEHDVFRGITMKRGGAHFGYKYVAVGQKLNPLHPYPRIYKRSSTKQAPITPLESCLTS